VGSPGTHYNSVRGSCRLEKIRGPPGVPPAFFPPPPPPAQCVCVPEPSRGSIMGAGVVGRASGSWSLGRCVAGWGALSAASPPCSGRRFHERGGQAGPLWGPVCRAGHRAPGRGAVVFRLGGFVGGASDLRRWQALPRAGRLGGQRVPCRGTVGISCSPKLCLPSLAHTGSANRRRSHALLIGSGAHIHHNGGRGRGVPGRTVLEFTAVADPEGLRKRVLQVK
jgi:hypothetical protein